MKIKERNPAMNNVYCEIGSSFGTLAIVHPGMCMHLLGKNIKYYGADLEQQRKAFPTDTIGRLTTAYLGEGGQRENAAYGWVRA